jgi:hypothetical protein
MKGRSVWAVVGCTQGDRGSAMGDSEEREMVFACNLTALDDAQRTRRALLEQWLQVGAADVREFPDGYAVHLDRAARVAEHLEEFVSLESRCCPFLDLRVRPGSADGGPVLEIRGGEGVKAFVVTQFGLHPTTGR